MAGRDLYEDEREELNRYIEDAGLCSILQALCELAEQRDTREWKSAAGVLGLTACDGHIMKVGKP